MLIKFSKWFHSSRVKWPQVGMFTSGFFGVDVFDVDLGVEINSIKQQIKSNSVSPGNMSQCGTPSFNDRFDHCFIVFEHIQWSFSTRGLDIWGNRINLFRYIDFLLRLTTFVNITIRFPRSRNISKNRNNQIPQFHSRQPIQSQSSVQRDDFRFCWTVRNSSLFLAHSICWNKRMTSKNAQCSSRSGFPIFNREVRVLKQSQSALFGSITHMTILFVFTCEMNVWNQSIQAFVTGLGPLCYGSCEFIHWPWNIRWSNFARCKHFRTIWEHVFDNSPTDSVSSSLKWWSSMHGGHGCME